MFDSTLSIASELVNAMAVPLGMILAFGLGSMMASTILKYVKRDAAPYRPAVPPPHTPRLDQMTDQDWRDFDKLYSPTPVHKSRVKLPSKCPHCAGPGSAYLPGPDELSRVCGFCGSLITGEER